MDVVVGVDLGGTKIAAAWVDRAGGAGGVVSVPTPAHEGPDAILDAVARLVQQAMDGNGRAFLRAVGVGTAGVVDVSTGTIVSATDALTGWSGTNVAVGVQSRVSQGSGSALRLPVYVENDVDAHAAGEVWLGAAEGAPTSVLVAVGTGVGGAVVIDGVAIHGAHHVAGEVGHVPTPGAEGLRCACGLEGHLEAIAAGPAILRRYLALGGAGCGDAREVFDRARAGDVLAQTVVKDAAVALGRAVAGIATLIDPHTIVIGGGVPDAGPIWWEPMELAFRSEVIPPLRDLAVVKAALGSRAPILGAARGAWRLLDEQAASPAATDR
ncbi:MAG: ROK family protein [Propionibacteriaceae bacterium]